VVVTATPEPTAAWHGATAVAMSRTTTMAMMAVAGDTLDLQAIVLRCLSMIDIYMLDLGRVIPLYGPRTEYLYAYVRDGCYTQVCATIWIINCFCSYE
jgi:hypothetical protein